MELSFAARASVLALASAVTIPPGLSLCAVPAPPPSMIHGRKSWSSALSMSVVSCIAPQQKAYQHALTNG